MQHKAAVQLLVVENLLSRPKIEAAKCHATLQLLLNLLKLIQTLLVLNRRAPLLRLGRLRALVTLLPWPHRLTRQKLRIGLIGSTRRRRDRMMQGRQLHRLALATRILRQHLLIIPLEP